MQELLQAHQRWKRSQKRAEYLKRRVQETREAYNRSPSALSLELQDEIVARKRRGEPATQILREMRDRGVTEYAIGRVLRAFKNDPKSFMTGVTDDIAVWR